MKRFLQLLRTTCVGGARTLGTLVLWSAWLVLVLALFVQLYIATTNELAVPGFVLHRLEQRLADSGLRATFGRTSFDPTGRVLLEDARISLPAFAEPVLSARTVFIHL